MHANRPANRRRKLQFNCLQRWLPLVTLAVAMALPSLARSQEVHAVAGKIAYDAGQTAKVRVIFEPGEFESRPVRILAAVRYAGSNRNLVAGKILFQTFTATAKSSSTPYTSLWNIPDNAATGRYDVSIDLQDAHSHRSILKLKDACSFAVFRKLVDIQSIRLNNDIYTSGDPVNARIVLKNMTGHELSHLRVEFSDRYWPWIAGPAAAAAASVVPIAKDLSLGPGQERDITAPKVADAPDVKRPAVHQYGVVVWDQGRKNVLAIAFSHMVFVFPPGVTSPKPYPRQYVFPLLKYVNTTSYRHFYPSTLDSAAIAIDSNRTMYAPGSMVRLNFTVRNPSARPWNKVRLAWRLDGPNGKEIKSSTVSENLSLPPGSAPLTEKAEFPLPPEAVGLYKAEISLTDSLGNTVASNVLELAVNKLPKSILIFCAHEDDEGSWMPMIRAAIENHVPVHLVYFTGGDAGSCDIYYEHSCTPADAMNFGVLRMDETRAVLGHLGLPAADIDFVGFPDGGSGEIWYNHVSSAHPFLDPFLACDHAPYAGMVEPNIPYSRDAAVALAKKLILQFNPQVVITAHPPSEGHIDHIVDGYIAVRALQELVHQGAIGPSQIKVLVDRVYNPKTLPYTPYHYANHTFYVSGEAATLDQEAEWYYQSQGGDMALGRIRDYDQLRRKIDYREILDWLDYQGWNNTRAESSGKSHGAQ